MKKTDKGFTLIEVLIASTILLLIVGMVVNYLYQSFESNKYTQVQAYIKNASQEFLYDLNKRLSQSKRLYGRTEQTDADTDYIRKLDLSASSRDRVILPTIRTNGSLSKEKNCSVYPDNFFWPLAMGNSLFFVEYIGSLEEIPGLGNSSVTGDPLTQRRISLYRFVLYYVKNDITAQGKLDLWNETPIMNPQELMVWESEIYADHDQFLSYKDYLTAEGSSSDRDKVVDALNNKQVEALWSGSEDEVSDAFYTLNASGTAKKASGYKIKQASHRKAILLPSVSDTLYSIAYNKDSSQSSSTYFPLKSEVPAFYDPNPVPDAGTCGPQAIPAAPPSGYGGPLNAFPGGFEIGIVGPNSGRNVFVNLTIVGRIKGERFVERNHSTSAFAKDY